MTDATKALAARTLGLLDLTDLSDTCSEDAIRNLCSRALTPQGKVAAVCVYPRFVALARRELAGSGVQVASVINFPHGGEALAPVLAEARATLADDVDEIDLVMPYQALRDGRDEPAKTMISAVAALTGGKILKVILETGALQTPDLIVQASRLALDAGADFIKTSTGKIAVSATPAAARLMLDAIRASGRPAGFKAAGGIRTLDDAGAYLALADEIMGPDWASPRHFRFGASGILDVLLAALSGESVVAKAGY